MKQSSWALCAAAVLTGQFCLHLMTTQPLNRRIDCLTVEVTRLHKSVEQVAASAHNATAANDLLSDLTVQGKKLHEARGAIDQLRRFEREVRSQGHAAGHTLNLVRNIGRLQDEIITQGQQISQLEDSLDDLSAFQMLVHGLTSTAAREFVGVDRATQLVKQLGELKREVSTEAADLEMATESLQQLAQLKRDVSSETADINIAMSDLQKLSGLKQHIATHAMDVEGALSHLQQLGDLKSQVTIESVGVDLAEAQFARLIQLKESVAQVESEQIDIAEMRLNELTALKQMVLDGGEHLAEALGLGDELVSLKDNLVNRGGRIDVARKHADGLLSLEDALADDANMNIGHAQENLDALVSIERRLSSQDEQIISAVESLELMSDLQAEFVASVGGLDRIRRGLTELVMLESTVMRTVASLQPLMELTNLRRLNADDLKMIARGMMEQRASRVAAADLEYAPSANSNDQAESLVPLPPTEE